MNTSKIFLGLASILVVAGSTIAGSAVAHHSFAMFDQKKIVTKKQATVAEFRYTNPHTFVVVNVREGAKNTRYVFELSSVNMLKRAGWKRTTLKAGDKIDVTYYPLRNGKPGGMLKTLKLKSGKVLSGW